MGVPRGTISVGAAGAEAGRAGGDRGADRAAGGLIIRRAIQDEQDSGEEAEEPAVLGPDGVQVEDLTGNIIANAQAVDGANNAQPAVEAPAQQGNRKRPGNANATAGAAAATPAAAAGTPGARSYIQYILRAMR